MRARNVAAHRPLGRVHFQRRAFALGKAVISSSVRAVRLSAVEYEVIRGLACGLQSKEIAAKLKRSRPTIESYVRVLYIKFDARSRAHLVARAIATGALPVTEVY